MDIITYALSKKIAAHAVSGIQSMSVNGQTLTINTKDSGVLTMTFPTPKDGVSVTDIDVNANNQIVFTMSDGSEFISGKIPTVKGEPGFSPTITENADNTDKIYKLDIATADKTFTTPNLKGADGQGGGGDSSVTLTQEEYEALTEEQKLNGLYYIYDTKKIYKNGVQYGASEPIPLTMAEYEALKEAGAIDEQQEYLIEVDDKGILINAKDIGYNNVESGIQATTVQEAIDKIAENGGSGEKNVQSDWNETDDTADGFIKNKPVIPDITGLATETYVDNKVADYIKTADLADVATTGSYNDLADKPTIPDAYDDTALSNRVKTIEDDYAKSSDIPSLSGYATETWVNEQGFLTQHQDISNLVEKQDGKTLISTEDISQIAQNKTDIEILNGTGEGSVEKKIADKLSEQTYLTKEIATTDEVAAYIADPTTAKFNVIYLVKDESATGADKYFEYQRIGNEESSSFHMTGDTSTDLSDYAKTADIPTTLPANGGNSDTVNNHTVETDVPTDALFTDTIYDDTEVKGSIDELNSNFDTLEFGEVAGGKNLFNKETAHIGKVILFSSGEMITNADYFCTDYIPVIPNTTYVRSAFTTLGENWYYDIDKNPLNSIPENENIFTTPENAYYVRLSGGIPNVDIAQLEEGSVATEYEPYIPSVKMLAEENTQQSKEIMDIKMLGWTIPKECPIKNTVSNNIFTQNVGRIDLGTVEWIYRDSAPYFYFVIPTTYIKYIGNFAAVKHNIYCFKYLTVKRNDTEFIDKTMTVDGNINTNTISQIQIKDSSYTDVTAFKNALKGVYLYYELATPITYTIDGNEALTNVNESLSVIGKCKNLLKPILQTTTINGITCTANGDGTYTLNGTKTTDTIWLRLGTVSLKANKSYKLIGQSPADTSTDVRVYDNDGIYFGNGTYGGATPIITPTTDLTLSMQIRIAESTLNNFTVKPMLTTNLGSTYDDFVPYTGEGDTLTHDVASLKNDLIVLETTSTIEMTASRELDDITSALTIPSGYKPIAMYGYNEDNNDNVSAIPLLIRSDGKILFHAKNHSTSDQGIIHFSIRVTFKKMN